MEEVRAQAERMVSRTEIVRQANQVAQRILDDADEEARRMRHEAEDYCDQKLAGMEIVLDRIMRTVQAGREKLQATSPADGRPAPTTRGAAVEAGADRGRVLRPGPRLRRAGARCPSTPSSSTCARLRRGPRHPLARGAAGAVRSRRDDRRRPGLADSVVPDGAEAECRRRARVVRRRRDGDRDRGGPVDGVCRRCAGAGRR